MNTASQIIAGLQSENLALKTENTALKAEKAELNERIIQLESVISRLKAKHRPPENEPRPNITRGNFSG